ncbi:MAG: MotA/TolQ/ExbB proton channel family protein, partial [Acidobacteriota bacterium]
MQLLLLLQTGRAQGSILQMIGSIGPLALAVLAILAAFSVVSLAAILDRLLLFRKANRETDEFLETFRKSAKFSDAKAACDQLLETPLSGMFLAGYSELASQIEGGKSENPGPSHPNISLSSIERSLRRSAHTETGRLRRWMMFLATTGSVTPFIGLFGTVWGIMSAFSSIGAYGTADLAVVAPGISE